MGFLHPKTTPAQRRRYSTLNRDADVPAVESSGTGTNTRTVSCFIFTLIHGEKCHSRILGNSLLASACLLLCSVTQTLQRNGNDCEERLRSGSRRIQIAGRWPSISKSAVQRVRRLFFLIHLQLCVMKKSSFQRARTSSSDGERLNERKKRLYDLDCEDLDFHCSSWFPRVTGYSAFSPASVCLLVDSVHHDWSWLNVNDLRSRLDAF